MYRSINQDKLTAQFFFQYQAHHSLYFVFFALFSVLSATMAQSGIFIIVLFFFISESSKPDALYIVPSPHWQPSANEIIHFRCGAFCFKKFYTYCDCPTFAILWQQITKSHPIEFYKLVPSCTLYKSYQFAFVRTWSITHNSSKNIFIEYSKMQLTIIYNFSAIMIFLTKAFAVLLSIGFNMISLALIILC